jgi:hypothetical protein
VADVAIEELKSFYTGFVGPRAGLGYNPAVITFNDCGAFQFYKIVSSVFKKLLWVGPSLIKGFS